MIKGRAPELAPLSYHRKKTLAIIRTVTFINQNAKADAMSAIILSRLFIEFSTAEICGVRFRLSIYSETENQMSSSGRIWPCGRYISHRYDQYRCASCDTQFIGQQLGKLPTLQWRRRVVLNEHAIQDGDTRPRNGAAWYKSWRSLWSMSSCDGASPPSKLKIVTWLSILTPFQQKKCRINWANPGSLKFVNTYACRHVSLTNLYCVKLV